MRFFNLAIGLFAATSVILSGGIAAAQTGMDGSYIGVGVSGGVTSGGQGNDGEVFGGYVQGRYG